MNVRNTKEAYGLVSKALHWLIAAVFISLIPIGWYMTGLSDEDVLYWRLLDLHLALGLSLFILVPVKLGWKFVSPNPTPLSELTPWELRVSRLVHVFFLAAMIVIPVTGLLFIASNGDPIELYHVITIPNIANFSKSVRSILSGIHYYLAYACAALIVIHIIAVVKHRFFDTSRSPVRMGF